MHVLAAALVLVRTDTCACVGGDAYGGQCAQWDAADEPAWCRVNASDACGASDTFKAKAHFWSHKPCEAPGVMILPYDRNKFDVFGDKERVQRTVTQAPMLPSVHDMVFIHIPKTGGSSIEKRGCGPDRCAVKRYNFQPLNPFGKQWLSPWHVPPDLFYEYYNDTLYKNAPYGTFCIVRDPVERYHSENEYWRTSGAAPRRNARYLERLFAQVRNRTNVLTTEDQLHRLPQSMFVWGADCQVLCNCAIPFSRLHELTTYHENPSGVGRRRTRVGHGFNQFKSMYEVDQKLWRRVKAQHAGCWRATSNECPWGR